MNIYIILTIIFAILITIFLYQLNIVKHEKFTQENNNNTLLIKKTNDFKKYLVIINIVYGAHYR